MAAAKGAVLRSPDRGILRPRGGKQRDTYQEAEGRLAQELRAHLRVGDELLHELLRILPVLPRAGLAEVIQGLIVGSVALWLQSPRAWRCLVTTLIPPPSP